MATRSRIRTIHKSNEVDVLLALGWYYPEMHRGVVRFARDHGWHITADFDEPIPAHWRGDGVITLLGARNNLWSSLSRLRVPIVDLAESRPKIHLPRVTMNNLAIGKMAADHFIEMGYQNYAVYHRWNLGVSQKRRNAYVSRVEESGYPCKVLSWHRERKGQADTRPQRHRWLMNQLLQSKRPLAVFCVRDVEAVEVIEACLAAGINIPDEVAVLGVDNNELICDCLRVPLSSIDPNLEEVGYRGAELLSRLLQGKKAPATPSYVEPVGVVQRHSSDGIAVDHPGVAKALRFIHENFSEPIGMLDVTQHVDVSRSGLEKAFREHFVRAPMEELRRIRLQKSRAMLLETDLKIHEIASRVGFQTAHNFCRVFKRYFDQSPGDFRGAMPQGRVSE